MSKTLDKQIEEKLALYRLQKEKKEKEIISPKTKLVQYLHYFSERICKFILPDNISSREKKSSNECRNYGNEQQRRLHKNSLVNNEGIMFEESQRRRVTNPHDEDYSRNSEELEEIVESLSFLKIDWIILFLKIFLWSILWKLFIIFEFGAVYFVCSCFVLIWLNLRSGKRKGPSAYSVFNPNCEQILGTYTAEKFEKELLHR